jgi:hypothetical protein
LLNRSQRATVAGSNATVVRIVMVAIIWKMYAHNSGCQVPAPKVRLQVGGRIPPQECKKRVGRGCVRAETCGRRRRGAALGRFRGKRSSVDISRSV